MPSHQARCPKCKRLFSDQENKDSIDIYEMCLECVLDESDEEDIARANEEPEREEYNSGGDYLIYK